MSRVAIYSTAQRQGIMRSRFERGERALCTRLHFDDTQMTRGVNEANTRRKRGGYAVKTREKRVCSVRKTRSCTRAALCIFERVSSESPRLFASASGASALLLCGSTLYSTVVYRVYIQFCACARNGSG